MGLNEFYRDELVALLPPGRVWPRHLEAVLPHLMHAFGDEFARLHLRALQLLDERSPALATELLDEWEADLGLPDACGVVATDTPARRAAVLSRLLATGGQTPAFYLQVLEAYGIAASIDEFLPHSVDDDVEVELCGEDWVYAWRINLPAVTVREFSVLDSVEDALAQWGDLYVECLIRRIAPAHTIPLFSYL